MNQFYNEEQKNKKISEEINLTNEQINKLKIKEHVIQYIRENNNTEEEENKIIKNNNNDNSNNFIDKMMNKKNEDFTSDLFSGLNMNFNYNNFNEQNENGEEEGGEYTGFALMNDDNNDNNNESENVENKIKELSEKIQNAVNVSKFKILI